MNCYRFLIIFVLLLTMLASGCSTQASPSPIPTSPPPTPTMGPVDVVKAYEDAVNRHDVPGAMALWSTEDVSYSDIVSDWEVTTLQDLQKVHEFFLAIPIETHYTNFGQTGDYVTCQMTYADACTRAFGMDPTPGLANFTMVKGKIQKIQWISDSAPTDKYWANSDKFMAWFEKTYPDEYKWTQTEGNWLTKENGVLLGKRFQEYGATLK